MKFVCLNCGEEFIEDIMDYNWLRLLKCPKCKSLVIKKIGVGSNIKEEKGCGKAIRFNQIEGISYQIVCRKQEELCKECQSKLEKLK